MSRYIYSLIRCVPDPRTGEFVTVGAIAGDETTGDWSIRQLENERRARKLAGAGELGVVHNFMARIGEDVDAQDALWEEDSVSNGSLTETWLRGLHHDLRNVVQLSDPLPIVSDTAEAALDLVFKSMIVDPIAESRSFVSRKQLFYGLLHAYDVSLPRASVRQHAELHVGNHLRTKIDFAVGGTATYQLAQTWSFQVEDIGQASTHVKSWGYALRSLRAGQEARVIGTDGVVSRVSGADVDLQIIVAPPRTPAQSEVFEEATEIFSELAGNVRQLDQVAEVATRARELVAV